MQANANGNTLLQAQLEVAQLRKKLVALGTQVPVDAFSRQQQQIGLSDLRAQIAALEVKIASGQLERGGHIGFQHFEPLNSFDFGQFDTLEKSDFQNSDMLQLFLRDLDRVTKMTFSANPAQARLSNSYVQGHMERFVTAAQMNPAFMQSAVASQALAQEAARQERFAHPRRETDRTLDMYRGLERQIEAARLMTEGGETIGTKFIKRRIAETQAQGDLAAALREDAGLPNDEFVLFSSGKMDQFRSGFGEVEQGQNRLAAKENLGKLVARIEQSRADAEATGRGSKNVGRLRRKLESRFDSEAQRALATAGTIEDLQALVPLGDRAANALAGLEALEQNARASETAATESKLAEREGRSALKNLEKVIFAANRAVAATQATIGAGGRVAPTTLARQRVGFEERLDPAMNRAFNAAQTVGDLQVLDVLGQNATAALGSLDALEQQARKQIQFENQIKTGEKLARGIEREGERFYKSNLRYQIGLQKQRDREKAAELRDLDASDADRFRLIDRAEGRRRSALEAFELSRDPGLRMMRGELRETAMQKTERLLTELVELSKEEKRLRERAEAARASGNDAFAAADDYAADTAKGTAGKIADDIRRARRQRGFGDLLEKVPVLGDIISGAGGRGILGGIGGIAGGLAAGIGALLGASALAYRAGDAARDEELQYFNLGNNLGLGNRLLDQVYSGPSGRMNDRLLQSGFTSQQVGEFLSSLGVAGRQNQIGFAEAGTSLARNFGLDLSTVSGIGNVAYRATRDPVDVSRTFALFTASLEEGIKNGVASSEMAEATKNVLDATRQIGGGVGSTRSAMGIFQAMQSGGAGMRGEAGASALTTLMQGMATPETGIRGLTLSMVQAEMRRTNKSFGEVMGVQGENLAAFNRAFERSPYQALSMAGTQQAPGFMKLQAQGIQQMTGGNIEMLAAALQALGMSEAQSNTQIKEYLLGRKTILDIMSQQPVGRMSATTPDKTAQDQGGNVSARAALIQVANADQIRIQGSRLVFEATKDFIMEVQGNVLQTYRSLDPAAKSANDATKGIGDFLKNITESIGKLFTGISYTTPGAVRGPGGLFMNAAYANLLPGFGYGGAGGATGSGVYNPPVGGSPSPGVSSGVPLPRFGTKPVPQFGTGVVTSRDVLTQIAKIMGGTVITQMPGSNHAGMDIRIGEAGVGGEDIMNPFAGARVIGAGADKSGYGNMVKLRLANNATAIFGHLSKIDPAIMDALKTGKPLGAGQILGQEGTTGNSTGYHLHFEMRPPGQDNSRSAYRSEAALAKAISDAMNASRVVTHNYNVNVTVRGDTPSSRAVSAQIAKGVVDQLRPRRTPPATARTS